MTHEEAFGEILNRSYKKCICTRCGDYQTHSLVYCKGCGAKFTYKPKTFFDALLAMYNRDYQNRPFVWYPSYIAAIHKRRLKQQFNEDLSKEFTNYIQKKLENTNTIK